MPQQPIEFIRGATFIQRVPLTSQFALGNFADWRVQAQILRKGGSLPSDKIADLAAQWLDSETTQHVLLFHNVTNKWPPGLADVYVKITSAEGQMIHSQTIPFVIRTGFVQ